jgi:hypothetical protein
MRNLKEMNIVARYVPMRTILTAALPAALAIALLTGCANQQAPVTAASVDPVASGELIHLQNFQIAEARTVQQVAQELAEKQNIRFWQVPPKDILADERLQALGLKAEQDDDVIRAYLTVDLAQVPINPNLVGFSEVDFANDGDPVLALAARGIPGSPPEGDEELEAKLTDVKSAFNKALFVYQYQVEFESAEAKDEDGNVIAPATQNSLTVWRGPATKELFEAWEARLQENLGPGQKITLKKIDEKPVKLYSGPDGRLALVIEGMPQRPHLLESIYQGPVLSYSEPLAVVQQAEKAAQTDPNEPMPPARQVPIVVKRS